MTKPDLFLLHFAGGNVYSFNFLKPHLEKDFNFISIELPGRGKRIKEKLLVDRELAVKDIVNQILTKLSSNIFIIYGHSMGASLGFLVINELNKLGKRPLCFIATGNPGPNIKISKARYNLPRNEFVSELKILGGIEDGILNNEDLFTFFEPILRADFEIVEKEKNMIKDITISTPIYACMGCDEKYANQIENWKYYTTNKFDSKLLAGDHFFINKFPYEIAQIIKECRMEYS